MQPAPLVLALALIVPLAGCETPPRNQGTSGGRIEPTRDTNVEARSPRSQDLTAATDRMAQDLASRLDVINRNDPPRVFVGQIENNSTMQTQDFQVFLVRLRALLNQSGARHGIEFVRERDFVESQRQREYGDRDPASTAERYASRADFVLTCEIYDLPSGETNYFLFSYQLVQLREAASGRDVGAGAIIWENIYEAKYE